MIHLMCLQKAELKTVKKCIFNVTEMVLRLTLSYRSKGSKYSL